MALFKKKKGDFDEEFDDVEFEEERTTKLKKKKFKDLNPGNKKKRKEPPKPWGRKERVLVLIALLLTAGISAVLLMVSSDIHLPKISKVGSIHLPKISGFKFEKTIILENDQK